MLLFRSEEHITRWLAAGKRTPGASVPLRKCWELAKAWYGGMDPRRPDWKPRTRDENQAILTSLGLITAFWELPRPT